MWSKDDLRTVLARGRLHSVMILDTCYSGTSTQSSDRPAISLADSDGRPKYIAHRYRGDPEPQWSNLTVLVSSAADEPSWELAEFSHGLFTHFLLNAGITDSAGKPRSLVQAYDTAKKDIESFVKKEQTKTSGTKHNQYPIAEMSDANWALNLNWSPGPTGNPR
jgi:hypothetical protein